MSTLKQQKKSPVYIKDWDEFLNQAIEIILDHPETRATFKYVDQKQIAYLKVTDGKRIVMFKIKMKTQQPSAAKPEKTSDTHFTQLEQFIKLTSKLMLKVDPNEESRESLNQMEEEKDKTGKGKKKKTGKVTKK